MNLVHKDFDFLFEVSWEVCNKVGGIYTVLSSKANTLRRLYGDRVIFVGPDVWTEKTPSPFFVEESNMLSDWQRDAQLPYGLRVRTGYWDIPGRPVVVLVDFNSMYQYKDAFYGDMWKHFGVDSLHAYGDYDEGCAFGHASAVVIADIARYFGVADKPGAVIAHFDEWTDGMGLLATKQLLPLAATVFTTHATSMGRSICSNGKPLYDYLTGYNGDQMSRELNMESKHSLEKAAAHNADVFTTVSDITADEAAQLLERRPDVVTPNGFEPDFVPVGAAWTAARKESRTRLCRVAEALTGRRFDVDDTFMVATSGRFEYRNKGIDVYLDSIRRLADRNPGRPVSSWVLVPAWQAGPRNDLKMRIAELEKAASKPGRKSGAGQFALTEPFITHALHNSDSDAIACRIRQLGFAAVDERNNNTFVIYVPCYLNGDDGIFNCSYYQLLPGMDATVFASYYEPWGYTPLESVAFGVPTVTTSLSGYGRWVETLVKGKADMPDATGTQVIVRTDHNYDHVADAITDTLVRLLDADKTQVRNLRKAARHTAALAQWTNFIKYYEQAYDLALESAAARNK